MTREEEIREVAHFNATKFSTRNGYTTPEEACVQTAQWADEHPKNPWIRVKDQLPENGEQVIFMCSRRRPIRVYYGWYREFHDGYRAFMTIDPNTITWSIGRVTHWMPFPQLPKGGKR